MQKEWAHENRSSALDGAGHDRPRSDGLFDLRGFQYAVRVRSRDYSKRPVVVAAIVQMDSDRQHCLKYLARRLHVNNWKKFALIRNPDKFVEGLLCGRPLLIITGHFGNWEMAGYALRMSALLQ